MARRKQVDITDEKYEEIILHLDGGGTKAAACRMAGIAYNTKRLDTLIDDWLGRQEHNKLMRAKMRKKAVSDIEIAGMITDYLAGSSIAQIADGYYRSTNIIKYNLNKHGAMLRSVTTIDKEKPPLLPEQCIADSFEAGDYVWSAKYDCIAKVQGSYKGAYRIVTMGGAAHRFQAYQPACELGCLKHLFALGVKAENIYENMLSPEEITYKLNEAVRNGNKRNK